MRILHVDHSPVLGGAERSVLELARAQRQRGHRVVVAVGGSGPFTTELERASIPWKDLHWPERFLATSQFAGPMQLLAGIPGLASASARLRALVSRFEPDVVQAHTRKSQVVAAFALAGTGVPLVWHLRDDLPTRRALLALVSRALGRANHAVALSEWLARSYTTSRALPRSRRIGVVPSGVDPRPLSVLSTPWLNGERDPVIGFVGQVAAWKAPHLLIEAAEQLEGTRASFLIIGSVWFPAAESGYGRWLGQRLAGSPARERVEWLPATSQPAEAFTQFDVLVHTSVLPEPFGRVLVEAMIARRPIVALERGSARELLDHGSAVFVERPDGMSIAAAVTALIEHPDRARRLAERAAARAAAFSPANVAQRMEREYDVLRP